MMRVSKSWGNCGGVDEYLVLLFFRFSCGCPGVGGFFGGCARRGGCWWDLNRHMLSSLFVARLNLDLIFQLDKQWKGQVVGTDLRLFPPGWSFRLAESQFAKLLLLLQPIGFLSLFSLPNEVGPIDNPGLRDHPLVGNCGLLAPILSTYVSELDPPYLRSCKCCLRYVAIALDNCNGNIDVASLPKGLNRQLGLLAHIATLARSLELRQDVGRLL